MLVNKEKPSSLKMTRLGIVFIFLLLFNTPVSLFGLRSDEVSPQITANGEGVEGNWKTLVYCPDGTYVKGYKMRVDNTWSSDRTALNSVEMECFDFNGNSLGNINSHGGFWGDWYAYAYCPSKSGYQNFMRAYKMLQGSFEIGSLGMKGLCLSNDEIQAEGTYTDDPGTWGDFGICYDGTAICGFQSKVEDEQGGLAWENDSALNHIKVTCCRLCDLSGGVFLSGNTCKSCFYTCKTCNGPGSNNCNSCFFTTSHPQALISGNCQFPSYEYIISNVSPPKGWVSSPTSSSSECGYFGTILGGYNIFGSGAYSTSTYNNLPPFFRVRILFKVVKIDSWDNEVFYIYVNSNLMYTSATITSDESFYTGSQCGLSTFRESLKVLFFEFDDNISSSLEIKVSSNLDEVSCLEAWGILSFGLSVLKCHISCKTCADQNTNSCISCYAHATKQVDNTCLCDDTYYTVSTDPCVSSTCTVCTPCYTGCRKCTGSSNTQCQSCITGYYFNQDILIGFDGTCLLTCLPPNMYKYEPARRCLSECPVPTWGVASTNSCEDQCPSLNYYRDASKRICASCHPSCSTCSGPYQSDCLSCSGPFFFYGSYCLTTCGKGKYGDSNDNTCKSCSSQCKECTTPNEPTVCTACYPPKILNSKQCVVSCDTNMYVDYNSQTCNYCHSNCLECFGPGISECSTCQNPKFFNEETNECQSTCSSPLYKYDYFQKCVKTCQGNLYGNNSTRSCDLNCANQNEFKDDSDNICKPCHYTCLTCSGPSSSNCLSCTGMMFLKYHTCVLDCGISYYASTIGNICYACSGNCLICKTPDSPSYCLSCGSPYFLEGSSCVLICSTQLWGISEANNCQSTCLSSLYYGDSIDRICKQCKNGCLTCDKTGCITCPPGRYLSNKECLLCPRGFFLDMKNGVTVCVSCQDKEEYVKTKLECQQAPSYYLYQNKCIRKCPAKTYEIYLLEYATCNQCPNLCIECIFPGMNCTKCLENTFFNIGKCVTICPAPLWGKMTKNSWICQEGCERGFFKTEMNRTCLVCNKDCATCSGPLSKDCLTCPLGFFLKSDGTCHPCEIPCIDCNARGDNCTKCLETMKLYPQTETTNTCMTKLCDLNCKICAEDKICSSCISEDFFLKNITLNERVCQEKQRINCNLLEVNNPRLFELRFSNSWETLFSELAKNTNISIFKLEPKTYNCSLTRLRENDLSFFINCNYSTNVTNESVISLKINDYVPKSDPLSEFYLASDYMTVNLLNHVFCNESIQKCEAPVQITPFIRLTNDPLVINYGFDKHIPEELDKNISLNTQILIPTLNSSDYTVKISRSPDGNNFIYNIQLTSEKEIKDNPILKVDLSLSPSLKSYENLTFTKTSVEIHLMDYYMLLPESKKAVENSAELVKGTTIGADQGFVYSNVIRTGSSFMLKSLIVNQMINLMRFINIKYPPNVLGIFKSKLGRATFFPEFELEADLEDGIPDGTYYQYNISPYILNNCGTFLLTCYVFLLIAIILNLMEVFFGQYLSKRRTMLKMYGLVYDFFVWNFPISYLMSKYLTISVLLGAALRYPTYKTAKGSLNLFFASFSATVVICFPFLILFIIRKIRSSADLVSVIKPFQEITATNERKSYNYLIKNKEKELDGTPVTIREDKKDAPEKNVTFSSSLSNSESPGSPLGKLDVENLGSSNLQKNKVERTQDFNNVIPYNKSVESDLELNQRENDPLIEDSPDSENKEQSLKDKEIIMEKTEGGVNERYPTPTKITAEDLKQAVNTNILGPNTQTINTITNIDDDKINEQGNSKLERNSNLELLQKKEINGEIISHENKKVDDIPEGNYNDQAIPDLLKENFSPLNPEINAKQIKHNQNISKNKFIKRSRMNLLKIWGLFLDFFKKNPNDSKLTTLKEKKKSYSLLLEPGPLGSISKGLDKLKRNFEVFHKEFSLERPFNNFFMFFEIMRQLLFTMIILCLEYRPLLQTVMINMLNMFFFALIIKFKPFAKIKVFVQNCIVEALLLLTNLGFLVLAILDNEGNKDFEVRMNVGWWICITNMAIILFMLLVLLLQFMTTIWLLLGKAKTAFKNRRSNKISSK